MSTSGGKRSSTARRPGGTIPMTARQREKYAAQRAERLARTQAATAKASKAGAKRGAGQSSKTIAERNRMRQSDLVRGLAQAEVNKELRPDFLVFIKFPDGHMRLYGRDAEVVAKAFRRKTDSVETGNFSVDSHAGSINEERVPSLSLSPEQYTAAENWALRGVEKARGQRSGGGYGVLWADYIPFNSSAQPHVHVFEAAQKMRESYAQSNARTRRGRVGSPALKSVNDYAKSLRKTLSDLQQPKVTGRGKNRVETPVKLTAKQKTQAASARTQLAYLQRAHVRTGLDAEARLQQLRPTNKAQPGSTRVPRRSAANRDARTALVKAMTGAATRSAERMKISTARMLGRQMRELVNILADRVTSRSERAIIRRQISVIDAHLRRADSLYQLSRGRGAKANRFSGAAQNAMSAK